MILPWGPGCPPVQALYQHDQLGRALLEVPRVELRRRQLQRHRWKAHLAILAMHLKHFTNAAAGDVLILDMVSQCVMTVMTSNFKDSKAIKWLENDGYSRRIQLYHIMQFMTY